MKRKQVLFFCILCVLAFTVVCCVSPGTIRANSTSEIPSIQKKYANRFEQTRIGMDISEFKKVWPEAIKMSENTEFVIYEFRESTRYYTSHDYDEMVWGYGFKPKTHEFIQIESFYFTGDKLVKYEYRSGTSGLNT